MMMKSRVLAPLLIAIYLLANFWAKASYAQEISLFYESAIELREESLQPAIDGKLDEKIWLLVFGMSDFVTLLPGAEAPAVVGSDVMLAYDSEFLYIGLRAHDPRPGEIRANYGRRDRIDDQDDAFTVYIDPNDGGKLVQFFTINANGMLADGHFHVQSQQRDFGPDFAFDGAAQKDEFGWTAEIKIPLKQLHFGRQEKNWRLVVMRNYVRGKEWQLRSLPLVRTADCYLCVASNMDTQIFWPQQQKMPLDLKTALKEQDTTKRLDFAMRASEKIMLEGSFRTSNPLPSNEIAAGASLNPGRQFASAREEDRQFFINSADLFPYLAESNQPSNVPVYTRSITDLAWGVRASTRGQHLDGVLLSSLDNGGGKIMLPSSYQTDLVAQPASMVSIAHARFALADIKIGALFSDRDYREKGYNRVMGQDLTWQLNPRASIRAHWLHSQTTARLNEQRELAKQQNEHGDAQRIEYSYRASNWEAMLYTERVSPGFRADNGFFGQAGYVSEFAQMTYKFGSLGFISDLNLVFAVQDARDWQANTLRRSARPSIIFNLPRESKLSIEMASNEQQRATADGQLHTLSYAIFALTSAPARWMPHISARLNIGDKVDAKLDQKVKGTTMEMQFALKPWRQVDMKMYWLKEWLSNPVAGGAEHIRDSALQMQTAWQLDVATSVRLVLSRGKTARNPALYEQSLELMPFDASLGNSLSVQRQLNKRVDLWIGVTRARTDAGANDAYIRLQWQL